jgi:hypothetical protein
MPFVQRFLTAAPELHAGGRRVKPYHVGVSDVPIERQVLDAAEAFLPRLVAPTDEHTPPAAFAIVHRGSDATYLNVYSWVWENVIECRTAAAGSPFLGCPDSDPTRFVVLDRPWIGCVWELGPFEHERSAWVRHILAPEEPDLEGYLADRLVEPMTGGPRTWSEPGDFPRVAYRFDPGLHTATPLARTR